MLVQRLHEQHGQVPAVDDATLEGAIEQSANRLARMSSLTFEKVAKLVRHFVDICGKHGHDALGWLDALEAMAAAERATPEQLLIAASVGLDAPPGRAADARALSQGTIGAMSLAFAPAFAAANTKVEAAGLSEVAVDPFALQLSASGGLRRGTRSLPRAILLKLLCEVVEGGVVEPWSMDMLIVRALGGMPGRTSWMFERRVSELSDRILNRAEHDRVIDRHGNVLPPWRWRRPRSPHYPWPNPRSPA
jgi:hypothetical protein